jgi:flagellar motor switch protein FliN/FliY
MSNAINNVRVPLEVVLGETSHTVEEIAKIGPGTIIELRSLAGEPVSLRAAGREIAKAEVVVIDENFGVRVTSVVDDVPESMTNTE